MSITRLQIHYTVVFVYESKCSLTTTPQKSTQWFTVELLTFKIDFSVANFLKNADFLISPIFILICFCFFSRIDEEGDGWPLPWQIWRLNIFPVFWNQCNHTTPPYCLVYHYAIRWLRNNSFSFPETSISAWYH